MTRRWVPMAVGAAAALVVASVGATLTDPTGPWYQGLVKPGWNPPDFVFPIAWTLIFVAATIAGVTAWRDAPDRRAAELVIGLFALNGALNILWSLLFFRMQRPDWALAEVALLWLSIAGLIWVCGRRNRRSGWLLVPYLLWVSVAGALNLAVVQLNPPFG